MKSYTDLEQSKKLAEILPLNTADMCYILHASSDNLNWRFDNDMPPMVLGSTPIEEITVETLPCWSLAALLDYLSANFRVDIKYLDNYWELDCRVQVTYNKELVDACYETILKLHELKML